MISVLFTSTGEEKVFSGFDDPLIGLIFREYTLSTEFLCTLKFEDGLQFSFAGEVDDVLNFKRGLLDSSHVSALRRAQTKLIDREERFNLNIILLRLKTQINLIDKQTNILIAA